MTFSRRRFFSSAAAIAAPAALCPGRLSSAARPRLLVYLIAEQFRPDYLDELWPLLSPGGFRRMIEYGSYFPDCQIESPAFTASGSLATLITGAWPALHGVVADRWFDAPGGKPAEASAKTLRAGTLFDAVLATERNRVFSIASGSGSAFLSGCSATGAFTSEQGLWKSARAEDPLWLKSFRESNDPARWNGAEWLAVNGHAGSRPLRVMNQKDFGALYEASPFALANEFALVRETVLEERAGAGSGFDLIAVVLGALGALGLETGAASPLMRDLVLHCDQLVSSLIDLLDDRVGRGNFSIAFTAAHGLDERSSARARVEGAAIANAMELRLAAAFDSSPVRRNYVRAYLYPYVYLNRASLAAVGADLSEARRIAAAAAIYRADRGLLHRRRRFLIRKRVAGAPG